MQTTGNASRMYEHIRYEHQYDHYFINLVFLQVPQSLSLSPFISAYSIKCYVCTGTEETCSKDKMEADKGKFSMTCPANKCIRIWAKKDGDTAVVNSCGSDLACTAAKEACDKDDSGADCAVGCCDSDLCNAGSSASFSVFLLTVCSVLGLALLK